MTLTPDQIVYWQWGVITINATLVFTWLIMALIVIGSWLVTQKLSNSDSISEGQNLLEIVVLSLEQQIQEVARQNPRRFLPFVGTLFLFIAVSNLLTIIPGYQPPTGSLSTTAALAACVFIAVPIYGIRQQGLKGYLKNYLQPQPFMLPLNIVGEISRTLALAVRLFANILSGSVIVAVLLSLVPLFFPILMQALGLLTGLIQAYIFAILAMVYIAAGMEVESTQKNWDMEDEQSVST